MYPAPARLSVVGKERWIQRQLAPRLCGKKDGTSAGPRYSEPSRSLGFVNLDPSFFLGLGETG